jgi:hypothetical protein
VKANQNQNYSVPRAARIKRLSNINPPSIVSKPEKNESLIIEPSQSLIK